MSGTPAPDTSAPGTAALDAAVVVAGAGPTGLMLAGELRLGGAEVIVVDRLAEPVTESRGLGFTARATEVFDQRGLLDHFTGPEISTKGHFGGIPMDYDVLPGAHFGVRNVEQTETEGVLSRWAAGLGVTVLRAHEVTGVEQLDDRVEVSLSTPEGPRVLRCAYLVGADGGRSTVRQAAGFDFPGHDATREMFLADIAGAEIRPRFLGERVAGGMVMSARLSDGLDRVIVCEHGAPPRERTAPPGFAEVAGAWKRLTGEDVSHGEARWISSFTDASRLVSEYRRGRVLLAGDAAHIHLPAGGQGLSVGVQDAVNLGWKLAAVVTGRADAALLDTYHQERHPVGERVLTNTRAQGLLYLGGVEVEPLRAVLGELLRHEEVGAHLAGMVSGLDIRYDLGAGTHPLLGLRMPPCDLVTDAGATTTTRLLHPARGVLLDLADEPALRESAAPWADRVDVTTAASTDDRLTGTGAVLLRPDGHVAWATPDGGDLTEALTTWFGPGAPRAGA
ncbi:FAD-dependent monooxygenase [Streptomyces purpureus]|uniref:3-(3-hydroxyphenyl)propionate hydroxylase n=1 Tax=Streptomyces purpureus TaxID=1951 RepID=A0A918GZE8_9ACTN|nr:FAD-dependent monooxygenase [Streptomyces purpureus]GGT19294.1 3-(3-hydroxyphenyl)propionate hydroxylase [Streptomyces purpureus]